MAKGRKRLQGFAGEGCNRFQGVARGRLKGVARGRQMLLGVDRGFKGSTGLEGEKRVERGCKTFRRVLEGFQRG